MSKTERTRIFAERLQELVDLKQDEDITLNQTKQAKQMNVPHQSFAKYANDEAECSISTICKIAEYYGVSTDYLLGLTDIKSTDIKERDICEKLGLNQLSLDTIKSIKELDIYTRNKDVPCKYSLIDTFNFIIEAINFCSKALFHLNATINFNTDFKGKSELEKLDSSIFEVFKKGFPEASRWLDGKVTLITNESYKNILKKETEKFFEDIVHCIVATYNPDNFDKKYKWNNMKESEELRNSLISSAKDEKEFFEYRKMRDPLKDEEELKELEEEAKKNILTDEFKEREKKGEVEWFEYPKPIASQKYNEMISDFIENSYED